MPAATTVAPAGLRPLPYRAGHAFGASAVAYALSLRAMVRLTREAAWAERAARTERTLLKKNLYPETGLFFDLAGPDERPVHVSTESALAPLADDALREALRRRLVEEHLQHPGRYRAKVGIPSVAMDEASFNPNFDRFRCWRGPSWINTAWLLVPPMRYDAAGGTRRRST